MFNKQVHVDLFEKEPHKGRIDIVYDIVYVLKF